MTPNRGDYLSVYGVARELAAFNADSHLKIRNTATVLPAVETLSVQVDAQDACTEYHFFRIEGVDNTKSLPQYMSQRLQQIGAQSINPAVDLANYLMFTHGQPFHVFDADKVTGDASTRRFVIRTITFYPSTVINKFQFTTTIVAFFQSSITFSIGAAVYQILFNSFQ